MTRKTKTQKQEKRPLKKSSTPVRRKRKPVKKAKRPLQKSNPINRVLTRKESLMLNMFYDHCVENDLKELSDNDIIFFCDRYCFKFEPLLSLIERYRSIFRPTVELASVKRFSVFMMQLVSEVTLKEEVNEKDTLSSVLSTNVINENGKETAEASVNELIEEIHPIRLLKKETEQENISAMKGNEENEIEFRVIIEE